MTDTTVQKLPHPINVPQTQWNRYKKLLRRYRMALEAYNKGTFEPSAELTWLSHDLRVAKAGLDDFVSTLMGQAK